MTRRERFAKTIAHQRTDRPVFDLCGCPQTLILNDSTTEGIRRILGITGEYHGPGRFDERILQALEIDTRLVGGFAMPPSVLERKLEHGFADPWGIEYAQIGGHDEIVKNPLRGMELDEIMQYPFPQAEEIPLAFYERCGEEARYWWEESDAVVVAEHPCYGVFELGCWMFGFDDFLYRMAAEPGTVHWFFEKFWEYQKLVIERYYRAVGTYIHCTTSGDDFGTQRGMFVSLAMFREQIAPYYQKRIALTKQYTHAVYQHHTCGSVYELIPTLASCGIDILNPIQPGAYLMEPERLQEVYGSTMSFWGGIDTQDLLVNASPAEVRRETARIVNIFREHGGYILAPAHCIQEDVPPENLVAIYEGALACCR